MAYDEAGPVDGRRLLLLHAGVADRRMWDAQWPHLTETCRVVRADLRGFGETPMPGGAFSYVDDVAELLEALGGGASAAVGASFGGRVALTVAAVRPDLVDRLVLLCPAFPCLPPTADIEEFGIQEDTLLEADDLDAAVDLNVTTWLGPEASADAATLVRRMQRRAFEVQLAADNGPDPPVPTWPEVDLSSVGQPTVVLSGGHDLEWFPRIAEHLVATMPRAAHYLLSWAGHLPSLERPAELAEWIRAAATSRSTPAPPS